MRRRAGDLVLEDFGDGLEVVFVPGGEAAVAGVFGPVVAEAAHFVDGLGEGPVLVFEADVGGDDAGAVVAGGTVEEDAALLGVGEDFGGDGIDQLERLLVGEGLEGIGTVIVDGAGDEGDAGGFCGLFFQIDPEGALLLGAGFGIVGLVEVFQGDDGLDAKLGKLGHALLGLLLARGLVGGDWFILYEVARGGGAAEDGEAAFDDTQRVQAFDQGSFRRGFFRRCLWPSTRRRLGAVVAGEAAGEAARREAVKRLAENASKRRRRFMGCS